MSGSPPMRGSEPDSERLGVFVIVVVLVLVVLLAPVFVWVGNLAGFAVIAIVAVVGLWAAFRWDRRGPVEVAGPIADDVRRTLVFVDADADPARLATELAGLGGERGRELHVVVPARTDRLHRVASDVDDAQAGARKRLDAILAALGGRFAAVSGGIGDSDDRLALEDALRTYHADELVLVNAPAEQRDDLQSLATERAERDVPLDLVELTTG